MTETMQTALDILDKLLAVQRIANDEYTALAAALQEGPPLGGGGMRYTVFLIDGSFTDGADIGTDLLRFEEVDALELGTLLRIAMRQDFDLVVRGQEIAQEQA